jgi:cation transport ATPase-like protein
MQEEPLTCFLQRVHTTSMNDVANATTDELLGLGPAEVLERQRRDGLNELPGRERRGIFASVVALLREPIE